MKSPDLTVPSACPNVLGRLLLIPSMLEVLPSTGATAMFLDRAIREIPGISSLTMCVDGTIYPSKTKAQATSQPTTTASLSTQSRQPKSSSQLSHHLLVHPQSAELAQQTILLTTSRHHYGHIILAIDDPNQFAVYEPYVRNIANIVATVLENRTFMRELQTTNDQLTEVLAHLEQRVEERTQELRAEIARREVLEVALRSSEKKYRTLLATASEGFWLLDTNCKLREVNQAFCTMLGYRQSELVGTSPFDLVIDTDRPRLREQLSKISNTKHRHYEIALKTKQGNKRYASIHATTLQNHDGKHQGAFAFITDITKRKQSEQELRLAATVFSHAREGIFITDARGTILDVNTAFTQITGFSRDDAIGHNPRILKSGRQNHDFYEKMWRDLLEQGYWCGEIWNRHKTGEIFAEMLTLSAVQDSQGQPQYFVALFSNITAQKAHQERLEYIAHYDALTDLPNRMLFADRLHQAMAQVERHHQSLAVVYLDLDGFKSINDTYGHEAGDQLLITVASRMKQTLREGDTIARLGGDEFVAILVNCPPPPNSIASFHRLLTAAAQPVKIKDQELQVSASLGVTFYPQPTPIDADQLLRQADQAMYKAKLSGKNQFHIFD